MEISKLFDSNDLSVIGYKCKNETKQNIHCCILSLFDALELGSQYARRIKRKHTVPQLENSIQNICILTIVLRPIISS